MTPMREDILKEAEACNAIRFRVSQWHSLHIYPDDTYFSVEQLESFYRAAFAKGFAAGQAEMLERAAKVCDSRRRTISHNGLSMWATDAGSIEAGYCADEIRALPVGENE